MKFWLQKLWRTVIIYIDDDGDGDIDEEDSECEVEAEEESTRSADGPLTCHGIDPFSCYAPIADAGPDKEVNEGESVKLEGHGSDKDTTEDDLVYSWGVEDDNEDCQDVGDLTDGKDTPKPTFTGLDVPKDCSITYELVVEDGYHSGHDVVVVTVRDSSGQSPLANAGPDKLVYEGHSFMLEGSATDADDDIKSYTWGIEDDDEDCPNAGGPNRGRRYPYTNFHV